MKFIKDKMGEFYFYLTMWSLFWMVFGMIVAYLIMKFDGF